MNRAESCSKTFLLFSSLSPFRSRSRPETLIFTKMSRTDQVTKTKHCCSTATRRRPSSSSSTSCLLHSPFRLYTVCLSFSLYNMIIAVYSWCQVDCHSRNITRLLDGPSSGSRPSSLLSFSLHVKIKT